MSDNPTKTRGIEKRWNVEINKRFNAFKREVIPALRDIAKQQVIINAFEADPSQIRAYMAFFQEKLDEIIVGDWQSTYQRQSYELAIGRAVAELRQQGAGLTVTPAEREIAASLTSFTATPAIGLSAQSMVGLPLHQETLEFLFTRSFEALEGMSQQMARQTRQILFDAAQEGQGIAETVRQINQRINVGRSRARLIAQTETIQAFQRGTINQARIAEEQFGIVVKLRWLTVNDSRVRDLHRHWHGRLFTEKQAQRNINASPFNCRCGLSPVIDEADTEAKRKKFERERQRLLNAVGG